MTYMKECADFFVNIRGYPYDLLVAVGHSSQLVPAHQHLLEEKKVLHEMDSKMN